MTKAISSLLSSCVHPMYLAQGLMSNVVTPDHSITIAFASILGFDWDTKALSGPFGSCIFWPETYGFTFTSPQDRGNYS